MIPMIASIGGMLGQASGVLGGSSAAGGFLSGLGSIADDLGGILGSAGGMFGGGSSETSTAVSGGTLNTGIFAPTVGGALPVWGWVIIGVLVLIWLVRK